jgi:hypothetical protein
MPCFPHSCWQSRMVGELVLVFFFVYYAQKEIRQMMQYKPIMGYFTNFANVFEWFFLSLNAALFITWLRFVFDPLRVSAGHRR